ncbi:MAG: hypothetical protein P9E67_08960, partial [Candidatus Competibacter sp.]|nr:hypothetical protein [Candidatus Competibacter sp.]
QYRTSGLYYADASGASLALSNPGGYYPGRTGGVTIITPRTNRTARPPQTTYLRPTGNRVVVGNSSTRSPVIRSGNSLFAGNDR